MLPGAPRLAAGLEERLFILKQQVDKPSLVLCEQVMCSPVWFQEQVQAMVAGATPGEDPDLVNAVAKAITSSTTACLFLL